jgi:hypothetical protein
MLMTEDRLAAVDELKWIVDSRASSHMSGYKGTFTDSVPLNAPILVTLVDNSVPNATHRGSVSPMFQAPVPS